MSSSTTSACNSIISCVLDDGISIPCEYTSYLAPLQSSKLYNEVRASKDKDKPQEVRCIRTSDVCGTFQFLYSLMSRLYSEFITVLFS